MAKKAGKKAGKKVGGKAGVKKDGGKAVVERVMTLHPAGKQGVNVERAKYEEMRRALLAVIPKGEEGVAFGELAGLVEGRLDEGVFGTGTKVMWWVTTVKQDLEARGEIEQVAGARPQRLRRV
ncbi:MAG: DUF6958 family protein [Phycisphaerales bacterium JB054]